eukprot:40026-Eustigmatos_ZCMA.PRE.1
MAARKPRMRSAAAQHSSQLCRIEKERGAPSSEGTSGTVTRLQEGAVADGPHQLARLTKETVVLVPPVERPPQTTPKMLVASPCQCRVALDTDPCSQQEKKKKTWRSAHE